MASKPESLPTLFDAVKAKFPASLEPESWYLVAASALVSCADPFQFGQLYSYLTKQPKIASPDRRHFLNKRLREFVMKQWVTIGVPKAATALFGLIKEEQPGDMDLTFSKGKYRLGQRKPFFVNALGSGARDFYAILEVLESMSQTSISPFLEVVRSLIVKPPDGAKSR